MLEIQRGEVAGAPLFWTDQTPAPRTAGLVFRVGFADETLPTHGITHLVEHLALFPLGRRLAEFNGVVGPHVTSFFAQGEPDELVAFLRDVSTALHALPHDRVEAEKRVLLAESAGHQASFPDRMARMRWGETGPGLADVRELGLRRLGAEDLDRWAAEWFTLGNAAVWLDGPPPDGIELPLPPGERRPVAVAAAEPGPTFPAYERDGRGGLGMTLVGEGNGFSVATIVARQRLFDDLRRDRGLVYDVDAAFELLGAQGLATLSAACEDADAGPVRDALLATLHDLAEHGPTSEELEHEVEQTRRDLGDPRALEGAVAACAERELHGREFHTAAEALERTRAVTAEDCATQLAAALETALLVVPETLDADPPEGFEPWSVPKPEPARPEGRGFREKETSSCRHGRCEIVIGEGRLHWEAGDGEGEATVPLDRLLALRWTAGDTLSLVTSFGGGFHFCASAFDRDELLAELASEIPGGLDRLEIPASEHVAAIDGAARERLPHVEAVTDELEALAEVLDRGEEPLLLAEAAGEGHPGLLAVTARRLVHLEPHAGVGRHQARAAAERRRGGRGGRGRRRRPAADPRGRRGRGHRRHPAARARGRGRRAGRAGPRRGLRGRRPRLAGRAQGSNPTPGGDEMPAGSNAKRERQYEHIKESVEERGASEKRAKEIAARTVNKERARAGEARTASRTSLEDKSSGERGGRRSGTDRPKGRTRDQLYNEARKMNIEGRSNMTKDQLRRAVDAKK